MVRDSEMGILAQNTHARNFVVQPPKVQLSDVLLLTRLQWVLVQIKLILKCNLKIHFQIGFWRKSENVVLVHFALNC